MPDPLCKACGHPQSFHGAIVNLPQSPFDVEEGACKGDYFGVGFNHLKRTPLFTEVTRRRYRDYVIRRMRSGHRTAGNGLWVNGQCTLHNRTIEELADYVAAYVLGPDTTAKSQSYCGCVVFVPEEEKESDGAATVRQLWAL